jgi:hypothetical protein
MLHDRVKHNDKEQQEGDEQDYQENLHPPMPLPEVCNN